MRSTLVIFGLISYCYAASIKPRQEQACDLDQQGFFVTPYEVTGEQARVLCQQLGGQLADITSQNMPAIAGAITRCHGASTHMRIQTWDTNSFGTSDLVMVSGEASGTVHVGNNGEQLYALCLRLD